MQLFGSAPQAPQNDSHTTANLGNEHAPRPLTHAANGAPTPKKPCQHLYTSSNHGMHEKAHNRHATHKPSHDTNGYKTRVCIGRHADATKTQRGRPRDATCSPTRPRTALHLLPPLAPALPTNPPTYPPPLQRRSFACTCTCERATSVGTNGACVLTKGRAGRGRLTLITKDQRAALELVPDVLVARQLHFRAPSPARQHAHATRK